MRLLGWRDVRERILRVSQTHPTTPDRGGKNPIKTSLELEHFSPKGHKKPSMNYEKAGTNGCIGNPKFVMRRKFEGFSVHSRKFLFAASLKTVFINLR